MGIFKRIQELEDKVWVLENPAPWKVGDITHNERDYVRVVTKVFWEWTKFCLTKHRIWKEEGTWINKKELKNKLSLKK